MTKIFAALGLASLLGCAFAAGYWLGTRSESSPAAPPASDRLLLAVNGTLMRGLELNKNLTSIGAEFVEETTTVPEYRLWSIRDRYPGMVRVKTGGRAIALEVWSVPKDRLIEVLLKEPPGLSVGQVVLVNGDTVWGILAEPSLCEGQREITELGGWRKYLTTLH